MNLSIVHRVIFTLILSGIMSASMTFLISSSYCVPHFNQLLPIWLRAWGIAFSVIVLLTPYLHLFTALLLRKNSSLKSR